MAPDEKAALKMKINEMEYTIGFYDREVEAASKNHLDGNAMQVLLDARKKELKELRQKLKELERAE
jgi:CHASE3 domain sensor protein